MEKNFIPKGWNPFHKYFCHKDKERSIFIVRYMPDEVTGNVIYISDLKRIAKETA